MRSAGHLWRGQAGRGGGCLRDLGGHLGCEIPDDRATWRRDLARLTVFFDYPPEIRKVIYTTNAIDSLNYSLRKVLEKRGAFQTDEAILKMLYLEL